MDLWHDLADQYRAFARDAADSPTFAAWSAAVAEDAEVLAWLGSLPRLKQQPNLVLAAARLHGVPAPGPYAALRDALLGDGIDGPVRATILSRSTQTNEVGRLATLVPAFALLAARHGGAPLSLLEVGASAGLCLYPDRYTYRWRTDDGDVVVGTGPGLACDVTGPAPLPRRVPPVAARRGIDLNPLDVTSPEDVAWLETLVWPEHDDRRARLRAALEVARADPPHVVAGDLLTELPRLVEEAAADGPVVVLHSAVIAYLDDAQRVAFDELARGLVADGACHWVSNESPGVLPSITANASSPAPEHHAFVLGVDGRAVAWTHGHGRTLHWLA
ncbi:DUF2332 domain-containing protein [Aeromicrobium sp. CnD17-E]|uniref:DUF2332 domain-containing protein n=1 Tax=Aeromicrobium sp. CnD17-E TaxID=2954487 RepID=UPI002097955F|nr:DUF2332 domain-containing protein [Aeromicrobium sp. CnD17-E]MCO7239260.1 DUF2332 domain-containing protein [Aeromicrobium sp. CnD17-E]